MPIDPIVGQIEMWQNDLPPPLPEGVCRTERSSGTYPNGFEYKTYKKTCVLDMEGDGICILTVEEQTYYYVGSQGGWQTMGPEKEAAACV